MISKEEAKVIISNLIYSSHRGGIDIEGAVEKIYCDSKGNSRYAYIQEIAYMRLVKVELEKELNEEQTLIRYSDDTFAVCRTEDLISVEKYQEIRKKQLHKHKKDLKDFMGSKHLDMEEVYTLLKELQGEE